MDFLSSFTCLHGLACDQLADVCDAPTGGHNQVAQTMATQAATPTVQATYFQVVTSAVEPELTMQSAQPSTENVVSIVSIQGVSAPSTSGVASVSVTVSAAQVVATSKSVALSSEFFLPAHPVVLASIALVCWWL